MMMNRREFVITATGAAALSVLPASALMGDAAMVDKAIKDFAGGASISEGGIDLELPEIAENGNTVPLGVSVDSPMTTDSYVKEIMILANGNPTPGVARFYFSPMSGAATASTRIRLAGTQDIIALAKMNDGSVNQISTTVKVTIGGCGG